MKIFKQIVKADVQAVCHAFLPYVEGPSVIGFPFMGDESGRIGLHAFVFPKRVKGYYETGERSHTGSLLLGKNRFYLFVKPKAETTFVYGVVLRDPILIVSFLLVLFGAIFNLFQNPSPENVLGFLFAYIVEMLFLLAFSKSQRQLHDEIIKILKDIT